MSDTAFINIGFNHCIRYYIWYRLLALNQVFPASLVRNFSFLYIIIGIIDRIIKPWGI